MTTREYDSAFPVFDSEGCTLENGLSKREYFAVTIMQGMVSNSAHILSRTPEAAVHLADELIIELNKKNEKPNSEEPIE